MKEISIYIHIPFCKKKCLYCDFPSYVNLENNFEVYVHELRNEIKRKSNGNFLVKTIFFGGGTPTVLSDEALNSIITTIFQNFKIDEECEITLEANPKTFDLEKLKNLRNMGFNRISMGVQAWQDELLQTLGRLHNHAEFVESFTSARKAEFSNINLDLMFALPTQTLEMWQETLENIVLLKPEHISIYSLIIEEETPFYDLLEKGKILMCEEELDREMYHMAVDYLEEHGYIQYEISNFAKKGKESRHNQVYWSMKEYMGMGLGSHSFLDGKRYHNTYDMQKYLAGKEEGIWEEDKEVLTKEDEISEYMFLGLRMNQGISKDKFQEKFMKTIEQVYHREKIERLKEDGLLIETKERIFLSRKGIDLSNLVFEQFLL